MTLTNKLNHEALMKRERQLKEYLQSDEVKAKLEEYKRKSKEPEQKPRYTYDELLKLRITK